MMGKIKEHIAERGKLIDELLSLIPNEGLELWKEKHGKHVAGDIVSHGRALRNYNDSFLQKDGFSSFEDAQEKFTLLMQAWKGLVGVEIDRNGLDELEPFSFPLTVYFTAL